MHHHPESDADTAQLAALGHKSELSRKFSPLAMLGLAFAVLNSWVALAGSISLALPSGGPTALLWGLTTAGVCHLALAMSLAEFLSAYPTAGGQYHWVAVISWKAWVPLLSWITGWINVSGWIALVASGGLLGSRLILGVISIMNPAYESQRWHQFLIYIGYNLVAFLINALMSALLPLISRFAFIWSVTGFVVISITILACASPDYSSAELVFTKFINETGWPDGIAWLLGLLQGGLGMTGFDAVAHMIEEIPNPAVEGPKIMIASVVTGLLTGFIFLMVLLFVAGSLDGPDGVITSAAGPLLQIFFNATRSKAGAICLLIFPLVCLLFATTGIMTTSSRMTYAFARDGGLPFSTFFAKIHPKLDLPLNALYLTTALVLTFGCIFLGSSSALSAIISSSVVALGVSYGIPIAINCIRGRKMLPESRVFKLPGIIGWIADLIGLSYVIVTSVLFLFPPELPVTASNMNYCVVAFTIILIISIIQWYLDGKNTFTGPQINIMNLRNGGILGSVDPGANSSSKDLNSDGPFIGGVTENRV